MAEVTTLSPDQQMLSGAQAHMIARRALMAKAGRIAKALRSSVDDVGSSIQGLFRNYAPLGYNLPFESLDYIELLSTYNPDYSQAVDNIRTLANSGHNLYVDAGSELAARKIKARLEDKARMIQESHGGIDGVIDKLLDQAATYGAMCGEWLLDENLTEVVGFVDMNPKSIRFFYEPDEQKFCPYQKVSMTQAEEAEKRKQKVINKTYVKLNEATFRYYAFDAAPNSPYGTPPFLAALAPIAMQRDMNTNMAQIVKKIGLLGIIDVTVKQFPPKLGQSQDEYEAEASSYLDQYVEVVEDMVKDGGMVHFDDVEVSSQQLTGNANGATQIWKQNEEQVFSGLKSMPSVQGRSYSSTETYAGVAYDIIIRNTTKYQRAAKRMVEAGYWLDATLSGAKPKSITIAFRPNKTLQRLQQAQADNMEIKNAHQKWLLGLIDQTDVAQELGYNEPKTKYDLPPVGTDGNPLVDNDNKDEVNDEDETQTGDTGATQTGQ